MVHQFSAHPHPFICEYKANLTFPNMLVEWINKYPVQRLEASPNNDFGETFGFYLILGDNINESSNSRWSWSSFNDDIITFAPNSTNQYKGLVYENVFSPQAAKVEFEFLNYDYSEEEIFQYSTVLDGRVWETLELFLYLKENCKVAFKMNLAKIDLDRALGAYKKYE